MIFAISRLGRFSTTPWYPSRCTAALWLSSRTTTIGPTDANEKKVETKSAGEHDFGVTHIFNFGGYSYHARVCQTCGLKQRYGRIQGSNKHPDYARIDAHCPGLRDDSAPKLE
eukprot:scaffold32432_cov160-Amphora_coffeaeformis.AAC.2